VSATRVVAITGASAGIGHATALRLARDGAALALCARRADRLEAIAAGIRGGGGQAWAFAGDVTRVDDMERLVAGAVERFGRLDVMICNAGFGIAGAIDEITTDQMHQLMMVNFMGSFYAARAALRRFRAQGHGHVIFVSSIVGRRGVPYMGAYSATKFAQVGVAECMRAELAGTPIHVTVVYPVSTKTEFFEVMSAATGSPMGPGGGPRQDATVVADAIARAIKRPVPEVYPHTFSRALVWLNAFAPGVADRLVKRFGRRPAPV
jgi:short-subunit dehydrogenase